MLSKGGPDAVTYLGKKPLSHMCMTDIVFMVDVMADDVMKDINIIDLTWNM